jgi:hypothetical protein
LQALEIAERLFAVEAAEEPAEARLSE